MAIEQREVVVAFTYAWWLTGDEQAAATAVSQAAAEPGVAGAGEDARFEVLLRTVRGIAAPTPTMCPASELALLHDAQGIDLHVAAGLVGVAEGDVGVELAHGRLEALVETVRGEFTHPERLGGLAVGNPADVAHARQCASCAGVRDLIGRGRDELTAIGTMQPPDELFDAATRTIAAPPEAPPEVDETPAVLDGGSAPPDAEAPPSPSAPVEAEPAAPEAPPAAIPDDAEAEEPAPASRLPLVVGALILALTVVVLMFAFARTQAGEDAAPPETGSEAVAASPAAGAAPPAQASPPTDRPTGAATEDGGATEPTDAEPPPTGGFVVTGAGLLVDGGTPAQSGTTLAADDPVIIAVDYRGGAEGVTLSGEWTVDGEPFRTLPDVTVGGGENRHVYGSIIPSDGWPSGRHRVLVTADGDVAASIDWVVS